VLRAGDLDRSVTDPVAKLARPRGVIVLGPAWYSCGSYEVFKRQMECCRALGLRTYFLAVSPLLGIGVSSTGYWNYYYSMTTDLGADARGHTGRARVPFANATFWTEVLPSISRSLAYWRLFPAQLSNIPASLLEFVAAHTIDTVICHHYFNLPIAKKVRALIPDAKLLLETQDVQSRHMHESGGVHPLLRWNNSLDELMADEMKISSQADVLIHYNEDETAVFSRRIPERQHITVFPAGPRNHAESVVAADDDEIFDFLIVASGNDPNYNSLCWFLSEVWSPKLDAQFKLKVAGNVDVLFAARKEPLYEQYRHCFLGRMPNLAELYAGARYVLLPVTQGHGIAIKTVEALSYGKCVIAMPMAYRGYQARVPAALKAEMVETAAAFRERLSSIDATGRPRQDARCVAFYEEMFSPERQLEAYRGLLCHFD
jgi:polysaccharide biosynthesis protein PslH